MTGKLIPAMIQGKVESILFARASSKAPAECGLANRNDAGVCDGFPGCRDWPAVPLVAIWRRDGDRRGEEKDSRYRAMKKTSLRQQKRKSTVCIC